MPSIADAHPVPSMVTLGVAPRLPLLLLLLLLLLLQARRSTRPTPRRPSATCQSSTPWPCSQCCRVRAVPCRSVCTALAWLPPSMTRRVRMLVRAGSGQRYSACVRPASAAGPAALCNRSRSFTATARVAARPAPLLLLLPQEQDNRTIKTAIGGAKGSCCCCCARACCCACARPLLPLGAGGVCGRQAAHVHQRLVPRRRRARGRRPRLAEAAAAQTRRGRAEPPRAHRGWVRARGACMHGAVRSRVRTAWVRACMHACMGCMQNRCDVGCGCPRAFA
jgi:hypothetical protein